MTVEPMSDGREALVKVNRLEMLLGATVGLHRAIDVIAAGRQNRARGLDDDGNVWTRSIEGAIAELATAAALDRYWSGAGSDDPRRLTAPKAAGGDVGRLQVRLAIASVLDQKRRMIVQDRDRPDETFVFVVGRAPSYRVVGWIRCHDVKQRGDWIRNPGDYGEAWFVPQDALHHLRDLPAA